MHFLRRHWIRQFGLAAAGIVLDPIRRAQAQRSQLPRDPVSPAAEGPSRFCIMGDRTGGAQAGVYERAVDRIVAERPRFVINVGDSIEGLRDFWTDIEWVEMKKLWRRYGAIPHYSTPGNHDIWSADSQRLYTRFTGHPPQYSFTQGSCHITVLDNSRSDTLDEAQIAFLREDLQQHRDAPLKLVFLHKPFWIPFLMLKSGEFSLHKTCVEFGVQWVFSGHLHHLWHLERDGVQYVSLGSCGGSMERGKTRGEGFGHGWFYHYGVATVSNGQLALRIQELPPPHGEGRSFAIGEWWENHPSDSLRRALATHPRGGWSAVSAPPPAPVPGA
ncbi:MAG: metallophosphoesterase [Bryobacterales bacterium]|jgi:hypothetical protein|nr:metallophosphoesterase [Bryobacterales bacterium]